ncbi:MAG: 4Fe-4S binding protein [Thermofilum sp.]
MSIAAEALRRLLKGPWTLKYPREPAEAPEGYRGRLLIDSSVCRGCGVCARVCPSNAVELVEGDAEIIVRVYHDKCIRCGECVEKCPYRALSFSREFEHTSRTSLTVMAEARIPAVRCGACGRLFISERLGVDIAGSSRRELPYLTQLCPDCRARVAASVTASRKIT